MDNKDINEEQNDFEEENQEEILEDQKHTYINIQYIYNDGVMTGNDAIIENINIKNKERVNRKESKESIISDNKALISWITQNYANYSMILMIACTVFNEMPRDWIVKAADELFEIIHLDNEKQKDILAFSDMIEPMGLEICKGSLNMYGEWVEVDIIRLTDSEKRTEILSAFWNQCINLREKIIIWLNGFNGKKPYRMSKEAIDAVEIFASEDYCFFLNNIIFIIMCTKTMYADMLVARTLIKMKKKYENNVGEIIKQWAQKKDVHYLLTSMLVCIDAPLLNRDTLESAIKNYIHFGLNNIKNTNNQFISHAYDFYIVGQRITIFYKLLIHHMYLYLQDNRDIYIRSRQSLFFLLLFRADIEFTRYEKNKVPVFIQLCYIDDPIRVELCKIWETVWNCQALKEELYVWLAKYEDRTAAAGMSSQLEKFVEHAFGNICSNDIQKSICVKVRSKRKND